MQQQLAVALLVLAWAAVPVQAQPAVPALTGRVVDTAGILSPDTERQLTDKLAAAEDSTGAQVAVLTVPALDGQTVEALALRVFDTWGLGDAARDDGVLLLVARDDRELRIEVGYGLEGQLTDSRAGRIIREVIVPRFRQGDFDGGVSEGVTAIVGTLDRTYTPPRSSSGRTAAHLLAMLFVLAHVLVPIQMASSALLRPMWLRYPRGLFALVYLSYSSQLLTLLVEWLSTWWILPVVGAAIWIGLDTWMSVSERGRAIRKEAVEAAMSGRKARVRLGPFSLSVGGRSSSGSGFSGGGGSSGGGGASGSW